MCNIHGPNGGFVGLGPLLAFRHASMTARFTQGVGGHGRGRHGGGDHLRGDRRLFASERTLVTVMASVTVLMLVFAYEF